MGVSLGGPRHPDNMVVFKLLFLLLPLLELSLAETSKEEDPRIVHGQEAARGSLPYQVSVQLNYNNRRATSKPSHFCGGALVADKWVLTAAHCMKGQTANKLKVVGGTNDITDKSSPTFFVERIHRQKYNSVNKKNDMALLELKRGATKDSNRAGSAHPLVPVPLCRDSFEPQGKKCTVSGWGHLKSKGSSVPDKLRKVSVTVLHDNICARMLKGYPWDSSDKTMICAGGEDKDACQGDSGGPLVCEQEGDLGSCIAGVVSWGVGCATEGIPGVYTNVRKYNNWIESTMGGDFEDVEELSGTAEAIVALKKSILNMLAGLQ